MNDFRQPIEHLHRLTELASVRETPLPIVCELLRLARTASLLRVAQVGGHGEPSVEMLTESLDRSLVRLKELAS